MGLFGTRKRGLFDPPEVYMTPGIGDDIIREKYGMIGNGSPKKEKRLGFWQGGDKFGGRDAIAGLLAVLGDAFANQAGMGTGAVENLAGGRIKAGEEAKKQAAMQQVMERMVANGMDPQDAAVLASDDTAARQAIMQKYEKPSTPAMQQNFEWWKSLPPEEQQRFGQYQDVVRPRWVTGADGQSYQLPTGGMPPNLDPNEWELVPEGGAGLPQAPRRFR